MQFNPNRRISAVEALEHPFISQFHNPDDEPICDHIVALPLEDDINRVVSEYSWFQLLDN